jgi:hypothetical protein
MKCADCKMEEGTERAYLFDFDHEGDEVRLCISCYNNHEEKGDWVA